MAFRYKLETLLRLQRSLEQQEENRLLACVARIAGLKTDLKAWQDARLARRARLWDDLQQSAPATVLQFASLWEQAVCTKQKEISSLLQVAEQDREKQLGVYRAARQKRETLESLKEHEETAYNSEFLRRIQQDLDETHLTRSFYTAD